MRKVKTYMDKLMKSKEFHKRFDEEPQNLCIGEQIAWFRHQARLLRLTIAL